MAKFTFSPSQSLPFRDEAVLNRVRKITREQITKHPNPDFKIRVVPDADVEFIWIADMFQRIMRSDVEDRKTVLILPNPAHTYMKVAYLINKFRVNCRNLYTFNMDEYANEKGEVAPESYPPSFLRSTKAYFWSQIDSDLRPPESHIVGPTTKNIKNYSAMIADAGGADACYSGPGWTGHLAFIEPDAPELDYPLAQWKKLGARIVTLSPITIAQNSLHGSFGMSGDMAAVPPRAATIGPADVIAAKYRMEIAALTTAGTFVSWQRMTARLAYHGPVTPKVPSSILQTVPTDVFISESIAANVEPIWDKGY